MKILFIITGLGVGGAEHQVCDLAESLSSLGHSVSIVSLTGEVIVKPKNESVVVYSLHMKKTFFGFLKAYSKAKKIIDFIRPDIVHGHMFHANVFSRLLRPFLFNVPVVCTAHSTNEGGGLRMKLYRITHSLGNLITNVSTEAVSIFEEKLAAPRNQIRRIYNGVDCNKFTCSLDKRKYYRDAYGVKDKIKLLIAVGRLEEVKDYPNLIKAFQLILNDAKEVILWIVGEGSQRNILEEIIKEKKLEDHVKLLGMQEDIAGILSASDLFVLSSVYEGFPLVVLEAMLIEKLVVATDCGGVHEAVGEFGFLCPSKDPVLLSKSINAALNLTEDEGKKLATNAREHVISNFSLEMITKQWLEIYENLIRDKNFYRNKKN